MKIDETVERIHERGWVFDLAVNDHYYHMGTDRFTPTKYTAIVLAPKGEVEWSAESPADALAGALAGMERMYGDSS